MGRRFSLPPHFRVFAIMSNKWKHRLSNINEIDRVGDCASCGENIPLRGRGRGLWRCTRAIKEGILSNPERVKKEKERSKRSYFNVRLRGYGISSIEFDNLMKKQNNQCVICFNILDNSAHIDHCHKSGKVRGLLCHNCNVGLGFFKDSIESLTAAITYLKNQ